MANRLAGKVAIVSGAGKGIGKAIAQVFAREGAKVVLFSRTEPDLQDVVEGILRAGGTAAYQVADASKDSDVAAVIQLALHKYGRLDIFVANAAVFREKRLDELSINEWDDVIRTNLTSMFIATSAAIPVLKRQGTGGRLIYISSISGPEVGLPGYAAYTASKGGVHGLMKTAAIELAKYKITVNSVLPGNIRTEMIESAAPDYIENVKKAIPAGCVVAWIHVES
eukprot:jgi/Chrzof1/5364/Cz16g00050.t1_KAR2[v5.2]